MKVERDVGAWIYERLEARARRELLNDFDFTIDSVSNTAAMTEPSFADIRKAIRELPTPLQIKAEG